MGRLLPVEVHQVADNPLCAFLRVGNGRETIKNAPVQRGLLYAELSEVGLELALQRVNTPLRYAVALVEIPGIAKRVGLLLSFLRVLQQGGEGLLERLLLATIRLRGTLDPAFQERRRVQNLAQGLLTFLVLV
eukprot:scaffold1913_cov257-Pinguiococcus_pyrenoidosus.AAC.42